MSAKLGILAGTFDPVHKGHIAFALAALDECKLERVYLLPELLPRDKNNVTDFKHRLAMLKLAAEDHEGLEVLQMPGERFSIAETLPMLKKRFPAIELNFLMGSDVARGLHLWPGLKDLLKNVHLIIGLRRDDGAGELKKSLEKQNIFARYVLIPSPMPHAASSQMRSQKMPDILAPHVAAYASHNHLYDELTSNLSS